ncbi:MAG: hypothetical protein Q8K32_23310 [Archangium sp.]|nr:hypothetical protein [Archangium sp.]
MIRSLWVEAVITPPLNWADGRPLAPCTPFELDRPITFGPRDSDADIHWPAPHRLVLTPGPAGVFFEDSRDREWKKKPLIKPGAPWTADVTLLVLSTPRDSAGWPSAIRRPPGPWSDDTLQVIADQLHELGLSVGQRFSTRDDSADLSWLPIRHAKITWRRGVVNTLQCAAERELGRALGHLAVCMPMRELMLSCREWIQPVSILEALISTGGLPCLEKLVFDVRQPELWAPSALRELSGFGEAFPRLNTFEVKNSHPPGIVIG